MVCWRELGVLSKCEKVKKSKYKGCGGWFWGLWWCGCGCKWEWVVEGEKSVILGLKKVICDDIW